MVIDKTPVLLLLSTDLSIHPRFDRIARDLGCRLSVLSDPKSIGVDIGVLRDHVDRLYSALEGVGPEGLDRLSE